MATLACLPREVNWIVKEVKIIQVYHLQADSLGSEHCGFTLKPGDLLGARREQMTD